MEADWAVEIGAELARIEVPWRGDGLHFIDLTRCSDVPSAVGAISEAREAPALFRALVKLNAPSSSVFTSKCDLWPLNGDEIDPYEFDTSEPALTGRACYIDLIFRDAQRFISLAWHERWMRRCADQLKKIRLRSARVDLVLRQADVRGVPGFGITVYTMGGGVDRTSADVAWEAAVEATVESICDPQVSISVD